MNVREARLPDRPAIRDVARRSIQASYSFGPREITVAIEEWYNEEHLERAIEGSRRLVLIAERDEQVVGFSESERSEEGETATLLWLHVDPAYRGDGVARHLFEETRVALEDAGADHVNGRVLADNADGNAFYEEMGYQQVGQSEVEISGRTHVENVWSDPDAPGVAPFETDDGRKVYVNYDESDSGSVGDFYVVYADEDRTERFGYYCDNCGELANSMNSMGRIECDNCGNARKPTRWDAAYL
jgi:ribosomal protein S18 acetylase RimI-like enzyme